MRDIERELRALGEAERERDGGAQLDRNSLRRIRMARLFTSGVALIAVLGLVVGGTYASSAFRDAPIIQPAEDPELPSPGSIVVLASSLETGRVVLNFDPARRGVCYGGDLRFLERMDIVEPSAGGDVVLSLFPADDRFSDYGYLCASDLSREAMDRVLTSPDRYALASVTAGTAHIAGLSDLKAEPDRGCSSVGFEPTYLPDGWSAELQEGSAVAPGPAENHVGFYGAPVARGETSQSGFANLSVESGPMGPQEDGDLKVLGAETSFVEADQYHGSHVRFGYMDCTYVLVATGIDDEAFIRFVEGLRPKSGALSDDGANFNALWPEDTHGHAAEGCGTDKAGRFDPSRRKAGETAAIFFLEVLGWDGYLTLFERSDRSSDVIYEARRDPDDDGRVAQGHAVRIYVTQAYPQCWSVAHVTPIPRDHQVDTGSMTVRGREVSMTFDLTGAASATFEVGYGGETTTHTWTEGDSETVEFELDFEPDGTGHFLILLRDADGKVFSAHGSGLPEGDFAAG